MTGRNTPIPVSRGLRRDLVRCAFMDWFGLETPAAEVLIALWETPGAAITAKDIPARRDGSGRLTANALEVRICGLRKAMVAEAIDTLGGGRYVLTEVGLEECAQALAHTANAIAREARRPAKAA